MAVSWARSADDLIATATCTAANGTESAPTGADDGLPLHGKSGRVEGFAVHIEATDGQTNLAAAGYIRFYLRNPKTGKWNRAPKLDIDLTGGATGEAGFGAVVWSPRSRVVAIPEAVGTPTKVYLVATPR
jgi:hypothetical protein